MTWTSTDAKGLTYAGTLSNVVVDGQKVSFDYAYTQGWTGQGDFSGTFKDGKLTGSYQEKGGGKTWGGEADLRLTGVSGQRHTFSGAWWENRVVKPRDQGNWTVNIDL